MATKPTPITPAEDDPQQDTVLALLERSKRRTRRVNIRQSFVQGGEQARPVPGPLHLMLKAHDERALDLFLLHRTLVSKALPGPNPWRSLPLDARVWARALGLHHAADHGVSAVSKTWRRLEANYHLVERARQGRVSVIVCLIEDGSAKAYHSPSGATREERYFSIPFEYWTADQRRYRTLSFPAKAILLVASSLGPSFVLPTEKADAWYGISTESAERGLRRLREVGLLERTTTVKSAPLSPTGKTQEYHYSLVAPFGRAHRQRQRLTLIKGREAS